LNEYPETRKWYNKGEKAIYYPNGSITEFSYLQNTDDVYNYQGREYEDISVDEVTQHEWEVIQVLRGSNRTTNPTIKPSMLLTGNPGGRGHAEVKRVFVDRLFQGEEKSTDYGFVSAKVWDNKALTDADPEYVERLRQLPEAKRKAWLDGSWDVYEGQFFSEFNRDRHVVRPFAIPEEWHRYIGLDWGVNAPTAVMWLAEDYDKHLYIYREIYLNGEMFEQKYGKPLTPRRMARLILAVLKKSKETYKYMVCDPSIWNQAYFGKGAKALEQGESIAEVMTNEGLHLIRGDNDRMNGWSTFREALATSSDGYPYLRIFENCTNILRELPAAIYDDIKIEDMASDIEDHTLDATRYILQSRTVAPRKVIHKEVNVIRKQLRVAERHYAQAQATGEDYY
jgi:phage terminase large subunit